MINVTHPCPDEHVLFTCSSAGYYFRWKIVFTNNAVVYRAVQSRDSVGHQYTQQHGNIRLVFTVVSTTASGTLSSTLYMTSGTPNNTPLNNTRVECEDSNSFDYIYYIIPGGICFLHAWVSLLRLYVQ